MNPADRTIECERSVGHHQRSRMSFLASIVNTVSRSTPKPTPKPKLDFPSIVPFKEFSTSLTSTIHQFSSEPCLNTVNLAAQCHYLKNRIDATTNKIRHYYPKNEFKTTFDTIPQTLHSTVPSAFSLTSNLPNSSSNHQSTTNVHTILFERGASSPSLDELSQDLADHPNFLFEPSLITNIDSYLSSIVALLDEKAPDAKILINIQSEQLKAREHEESLERQRLTSLETEISEKKRKHEEFLASFQQLLASDNKVVPKQETRKVTTTASINRSMVDTIVEEDEEEIQRRREERERRKKERAEEKARRKEQKMREDQEKERIRLEIEEKERQEAEARNSEKNTTPLAEKSDVRPTESEVSTIHPVTSSHSIRRSSETIEGPFYTPRRLSDSLSKTEDRPRGSSEVWKQSEHLTPTKLTERPRSNKFTAIRSEFEDDNLTTDDEFISHLKKNENRRRPRRQQVTNSRFHARGSRDTPLLDDIQQLIESVDRWWKEDGDGRPGVWIPQSQQLFEQLEEKSSNFDDNSETEERKRQGFRQNYVKLLNLHEIRHVTHPPKSETKELSTEPRNHKTTPDFIVKPDLRDLEMMKAHRDSDDNPYSNLNDQYVSNSTNILWSNPFMQSEELYQARRSIRKAKYTQNREDRRERIERRSEGMRRGRSRTTITSQEWLERNEDISEFKTWSACEQKMLEVSQSTHLQISPSQSPSPNPDKHRGVNIVDKLKWKHQKRGDDPKDVKPQKVIKLNRAEVGQKEVLGSMQDVRELGSSQNRRSGQWKREDIDNSISFGLFENTPRKSNKTATPDTSLPTESRKLSVSSPVYSDRRETANVRQPVNVTQEQSVIPGTSSVTYDPLRSVAKQPQNISVSHPSISPSQHALPSPSHSSHPLQSHAPNSLSVSSHPLTQPPSSVMFLSPNPTQSAEPSFISQFMQEHIESETRRK